MKEYPELFIGDLYHTTNITTLYDADCIFITYINPDDVVLLIDDRYFFMYVVDLTYDESSFNNARITYSFIPYKKAKRLNSANEAYIKVAYNNMIGYVNMTTLFQIEKQSC